MDKAQLAKECVAIDEAGGNVREYLASKGFISPWGTWYRLQIEELGRSKNQITEGKGDASMSKITLEQKKKAVEMAIRGESPLTYLKKCGSAAPDKTWWYIKSKLKEADPELYAKIPDMRKVETEEPKPATCCAPSTRKGVEVPDEIPEEKPTAQLIAKVVPVKLEEVKDLLDAPVTDAEEKPKPGIVSTLTHDKDGNLRMEVRRPLNELGIIINGMVTPIGNFNSSGERLCFFHKDETLLDGMTSTNMSFADWRLLLKYLPIVLEIMEEKNDKNEDEIQKI